ncbi:MAG: hypothetical protein AAFZ17_20505 [Cyanobacteria bacterium J06650_10]
MKFSHTVTTKTTPEPLRFTHEVSFAGPLAFIFSRLLGERFQQVLPSVMQQLKSHIENPPENSQGRRNSTPKHDSTPKHNTYPDK